LSILKISWWESERGEVAREGEVWLELGLVRMKWGWIGNIPTEIPLKGVAPGKNRSDRFQKPVRPVSLRKPKDVRI
jgi:hypothetical protein